MLELGVLRSLLLCRQRDRCILNYQRKVFVSLLLQCYLWLIGEVIHAVLRPYVYPRWGTVRAQGYC